MPERVRRMNAGDRPAWTRFMADVPRGEERFFKDDLTDPARFARWTQDPGRLVAVAGEEIEGCVAALELGCTHVYVEVVAEQTALVAMFRKLGFEPEALLADFVRDGAGESHDLMLLTHHAADNWSALAGLGLAEVGE